MKHACIPIVLLAMTIAGCAAPPPGPRIVGEHSARYDNVWMEDSTPPVAVHHTFALHNAGAEPATFVAHRTRINTVWSFTDTGGGSLPRTLAPGETVEVAMRGRSWQRGPVRYFTDLTLDTGEVVTLELYVDD